ncbi:cytochrome P450 [Anabaena sp. FACHB-709]|uniref:Cytochrome P450 n=2 Tax=Nostocaceae TaxID=1162 RepID=A0A1Z4KMY3_ANAVA|nr:MULTISPECIES: cytochrome P450 [Nostocaceae]BAY70371.1 cytochrome P450 [Trichormus variabilis NIES-23]HBW29026.1 cytochrome P450 [Nostoc sp. UBA8866]MBD2174308.1 cytochrome P450 [Anabaena cylindrica FACHB-318]MBD2266026.1 cytochrome P450 [Anabaena sp. FACHB-709]MBD2275400.1 cytochrome P450 [Nostoc sp. PCC 7120 = FACHB-418]
MTVTQNLPNGPRIPRLLRLFKFITQPIQYVEDFAKVYGDNFTIWGSGESYFVYFSHPQALEQIFTNVSCFESSGGGSPLLELLLGKNSLILLEGDRHQRQRQLLTPPFHGERMRAYGQTIREITQQVTQAWQMGKPFNIRASMQEITMRVILRVVFGVDEGELFQELRQLLTTLLDFMGSPLMSSTFFFSFTQKDYGAWSPWGRMVRLIKKIDQLIYALIAQRRAEFGENRQDILSLLISARYDDGQPMSDVELRDELMTMLVAGHETTASALTWAFYWIDSVPEVREKLFQELDTLNDDSEPSIIAKLPYLTAVCQETLRFYPIVLNAFFRRTKNPMEIMGYKLPKATLVVPSIYLAHHREEVYPQSKQFRPERFLEKQFSPYEYLPFGGGNRRCIGLAFAQYEMKIVLATILSQFQVSRLSKRPVQPVRRGLTLAAPGGMKMVANKRMRNS